MNYINSHRRFITSEKRISKNALVPGAITFFTYIDENKKVSKQLVLVLNPIWRGNMHGLILSEIPPMHVQKLAEAVDVYFSKRLNEMAKLRLPLVKVNLGSPKVFYESYLRGYMKRNLKTVEAYREFHLNKMSAVSVVEYRYKVQEEKDLLEAARKEKDRKALEKYAAR